MFDDVTRVIAASACMMTVLQASPRRHVFAAPSRSLDLVFAGRQGVVVGRPADGASSGDDSQPRRLVHEDRSQNAARPRPQNHHVHGHQ